MALKRVNLNLDQELIDSLDAYADQMHVSRSAGLSFILSNFFKGEQNMKTVANLVDAYNEAKNQSNGDLRQLVERLKTVSVN